MNTQTTTETASARPENDAQELIEKAQDMIVEGTDPNGAFLNLREALSYVQLLTAQRDELLAALKRAQRVIDGSDGNNLPAIRREEKIDEILATAIAAAERSNEQ